MANSWTLTDPTGKKMQITAEQAASYNQGANKLAAGFSVTENKPAQAVPSPTPLQTPTPATSLKQTPTISLPKPTATAAQVNMQDSIATTVNNSRAQLEKTYAEQKKAADDALKTVTAERDKLLADAKELTTPFREDLQKKENARLSIETNFQENQKLVNQLDALLQQGNNMIARKNGVSMNNRAAAIRTQRTIEDVQARAGVVEAVINARNNQITVAQNMIDRSVNAIVADRTDSLNYYNTLLELHNAKILTLDKESKDIAEKQVALVENDLANAEETAKYIKDLMINPETATFMADAGVSLTDSVAQIQEKMARQVKVDQVRDARNKLVEAGYELSPYATADTIPIEVGGTTLYARVRPGSEQDLKLQQLKASIESTNALAAQRVGGGAGGGGVFGGGTTYASDMDALVGSVLSTIPTKFGQQQFQAQVARARDDADVLNIVASQVLKAQGAEVRRDFANQAIGISEIDKAIAALDAGVQTGAIPAGAQYLFNFVGKDYDPKLAQVNQHIIAALQPYRSTVTGAAWGTQEDQEYAQLFGGTKFEPEALKQRLLGIKEVLKSKSANALNAFANPMGYGQNQFATGLYTPADQATQENDNMLSIFDQELGLNAQTTSETVESGGYLSNLWNAILGK